MNQTSHYQNDNTGAAVATAALGVRRSSKTSDTQSLGKNLLQFFLFAYFACFAVLILSGCSVVTGKRTPDGTITVTSWRCLWKTEAVNVSAAYAVTNFNLNLSVGKSETDSAAVAAVTSGVVKGLTRP